MDHRTELVDVIRRVRNRWRLRLALRGAVVVVAGTLLALLLSASGLEALRFSADRHHRVPRPRARRVRRPARSTASSGRCAGASPTRRSRCTSRNATRRSRRRILSAVEAIAPTADRRTHSPRLVEKLVEQAIEKCRALDDGTRDRARRRSGATLLTLGGVAAVAALLVAFGPAYPAPRPVGAARRLAQRRSVEPVQHRRHARQHQGAARRRSDGQGEARRLHRRGRSADDAHAAERPFERVPLVAGADAGDVRGHALPPREADRVLRRVERRPLADVHAGRSSTCRPSSKLELEYRFPAYTGLAPRKVEAAATSPRSAAPKSCCTSRRR